MEESFRALLIGSAAVTAIVPAARINWGEIPQGDPLPSIVLNTISNIEGLVMNGRNQLFAGLVQVDCYAETYGQAKTLSRVVQSLLHAYRAGEFRLISHQGTRDSRESGNNEATRPYRVSLDFNVAWRA